MSGFYGYGDDGGKWTDLAKCRKGYDNYLKKHPKSTMSFAKFKKSNYAPAKVRKTTKGKKRGQNKGTAAKRSLYNRWVGTQRLVLSHKTLRKQFNDLVRIQKEVARAAAKAAKVAKKVGAGF